MARSRKKSIYGGVHRHSMFSNGRSDSKPISMKDLNNALLFPEALLHGQGRDKGKS